METVRPFFSIVIPTYNRAGFIKAAVESALAQNYDNFEVIVVDDGSKDDTEEVLKDIDDPRLAYHKINNGERGRARNYGASLAKGAYVNFFDSDDLLLHNHLTEAASMVNTFQNPEVFHLGYNIYSAEEKTIIKQQSNFQGNLNEELLKHGNLLSCNGVFIRKDIFDQHKFIEDRTLAGSEDYELWLRLASRYPIRYSNTITSTIINHDMRSVLNFNPEKLIQRINALHHYIFSDAENRNKIGAYKPKIESSGNSYISLHLALSGHKRKAIIFLIRSLLKSPASIFTRRFLAIIKHLLKRK